MNSSQLKEMQTDAMQRLMQRRSEDGMWRGSLSSSAISTAVSVFALWRMDTGKYAVQIDAGVRWLQQTMKTDGSWGDSVESPSNMTATLLTYVSLYAVGQAPSETRKYLANMFGGDDEEALVQGVLRYYGRDLTFSVPILMMCALAGVITNWKKIPPFPFELATLPQRFFRFLNLPVVSYAIPALIAIGICQMHQKGGLFSPIRKLFVPKAMRVLLRMQPADGGFLEAAPLTAFVSMCLAAGGFREHEVTRRCAKFLIDTVREDLEAEIERAISAETALDEKIDEETERATEREDEIEQELFEEIERATATEAEISGLTIITTEDKNPYTLKAAKGEDDEFNLVLESKDDNPDHFIKIKFDGNFGKISW